jgi:hypothetical protein
MVDFVECATTVKGMCLARTHIPMGAAVGAAVALLLHLPSYEVFACAALAGGAATLPDTDVGLLDGDSIALHSFPPVSQAACELIHKISGGHRHKTHLPWVSVIVAILFGLLTVSMHRYTPTDLSSTWHAIPRWHLWLLGCAGALTLPRIAFGRHARVFRRAAIVGALTVIAAAATLPHHTWPVVAWVLLANLPAAFLGSMFGFAIFPARCRRTTQVLCGLGSAALVAMIHQHAGLIVGGAVLLGYEAHLLLGDLWFDHGIPLLLEKRYALAHFKTSHIDADGKRVKGKGRVDAPLGHIATALVPLLLSVALVPH